MTELAQKLIALEETSDLGSNSGENSAFRVLEKLRLLLTRFAGTDGFTALMRRALAVTRGENPSLASYTLGKDGTMSSLKKVPAEAGLSLAANLLDLMATFIGEALTVSLLADIWPLDKKG